MKFSANGAKDKLAHLKRWTEMEHVSYMYSVHSPVKLETSA